MQSSSPHTPDALYHVWQLADGPRADGPAFYYAESTAPENIDREYVAPCPDEFPAGTRAVDDQGAAREIAERLARHPGGGLVFLVNGFNTARGGSIDALEGARAAIEGDAATSRRDGLIFIGYRWPSETLLSPRRSSWKAASSAIRNCLIALVVIFLVGVADFLDLRPDLPGFPPGALFWAWVEIALIALAAALFVVLARWVPLPDQLAGVLAFVAWLAVTLGAGAALWRWEPGWLPPFVSLAWLLALLVAFTVPVGLLMLRVLVYFRDVYRATNYAVPDLLQLIRTLDGELAKTAHGQAIGDEERGLPPGEHAAGRIRVSFIGHSMGAFIVTGLVRILSDVFAVGGRGGAATAPATAPNSKQANQRRTRADSALGKTLRLGRLVLLSPDIPAATLLTHRANFLRAALRRFEESYLFSSEGDEILRTVSTLANYFVLPTAQQAHGYRLGNAQVRPAGSLDYGFVNHGVSHDDERFMESLRIGQRTLLQLHKAVNGEDAPVREPGDPHETIPFPLQLTYFDCTDYREPGGADGLLTRAYRRDKLNSWDHTALLVQYLVNRARKIDIHGGYFQGAFSQQLFYRLACLGYADAVAAYGGDTGLDTACRERQVRVLLSPERG